MRYIIGLGIAVLALTIGAGTTSALQPSGSYQQTCRNIKTHGNTLYAECQDTSRNWHSTQLQDYRRCTGQIQNLNGNLECTGGNGQGVYDRDRDRDRDRDEDRDHDRDRDRRYGQGGIPYGSYSQTCQDIRVHGKQLKARCQKRSGGWRDTSLNNFQGCREIENDNGKLRCR